MSTIVGRLDQSAAQSLLIRVLAAVHLALSGLTALALDSAIAAM